jgi:hypothetical protein
MTLPIPKPEPSLLIMLQNKKEIEDEPIYFFDYCSSQHNFYFSFVESRKNKITDTLGHSYSLLTSPPRAGK